MSNPFSYAGKRVVVTGAATGVGAALLDLLAEIGGVTVPKGNQVVLMYGSANRDPKHFTDPERFDVTRQPNPHIAFGFGTHFCLGTALARLEIKTFFEEFVRRVASFRLTPGTTPEEMPNAFVYGLRSAHLDLQFA